jgi:THUMP domain-like
VRAHLVRHYAARHALSLVDPHMAYLTGPVVPSGVRGFLVLDAAPFREKTVAGWARRDRIGTLEIKQRGTPLIPDDLRRRLRPALIGPTTAAATLVVARIGRDAHAFWCRAVEPGQRS